MKQEYAEAVAARIIEQLEQGTAPWLKPWKPGELRMPYNPKTGSQYRGMNSLWLHMQGYADPRWMTYKQAASEEAQVKKGEKGTQIIYWKFTDEIKAVDEQGQPIIDPETGEQKKIVVKLDRPRSFSAVVFNAEQIDGLPPLEARPIQPEPERHSRAEAILAASGANIQHIEGDRAFYRPSTDSITLPLLSQFSSSDAYYATALHELGHWTGHESRLDRDLNHPFGSEGYAREELRAEIASFMLGERLDIGHDPGQHIAYIGSWVKTLKEDPREIFRAAADAEHIAGFVMGFEQEQFKDMEKPIIVAEPLNEPVNNPDVSQARTYLTVPYAEKNEAKAAAKEAGFQLKWDKEAKSWYAPQGANLEAVSKWLTDGKIQEDETPKEGDLSQGLPNQSADEIELEQPQNSDPQLDGPGYDPQPDSEQISVSNDERFIMYHEPQPESISPSRTYLAVPYAEKDEAKAAAKEAGFQLKWDKEAKSWYAPQGANLEAVSKWRTDNGNVLKNTEEKESVESQFARALKEAKLVVDSPVMDGKLHRVPTTTDKKGGLSGAYAGHLDGITAGGYIQNYHTGEVIHWKPEGAIIELTPEQRAEQTQQAQQQYEARQAETLAKHEATAEAAQILWKEAPLATPENQYCKAKGMLNPAASGLKEVPYTVSPEAHAKGIRIAKTAKEAKDLRLQDPKNRVFKAGDLLVPCYDIEGKLWSLQSVNPYFKSLMKGGRKAGLLSVVGAENVQTAFDKAKSDPSFPLVLAGEGIATADTVSRLMRDRPVFLAIDSGNIDSVARQLREKDPTGLLLIAADNDHMKPRELDENGQPQKNIGLIKAKEAAENHGAGLMVPKFDHDEKGSDWNDLAANRGDKVVQRMLADEFIVAKRDAAIAADRMISLARSREAEARNDPTTSADDAYIASERNHSADMIAGASRHVSNINMAIADGKINTKGVNNRASINASIQSKSTSMNEKIKAERQSVTYEDAQKKGEEALKPKKTRSRSYDAGM